MKRIITFIAASVMAISCNEAPIEKPTDGGKTTFATFNLSMDEVRAEVDASGNVWKTEWKDGDQIQVISLDEANKGDARKMVTCSGLNSDGDAIFSGEVYTGKNRIISAKSDFEDNTLAVTGSTIQITTAPSNLDDIATNSLISAEVIDVKDAAESLIVPMKHTQSGLDLQLTFNLAQSQTVKIKSIKIFSNTTYSFDLAKGVDEDGFRTLYGADVSGYTLNLSKPAIVTHDDNSCSIKMLVDPITIKSNEPLPITLTLGDDTTLDLEVAPENDFTLTRGTYSYIRKTIKPGGDLEDLTEGTVME